MAINTFNEKIAAMEWCNILEPGMPVGVISPFSPGTQQQLIWGYPGIKWGLPAVQYRYEGLRRNVGKMMR